MKNNKANIRLTEIGRFIWVLVSLLCYSIGQAQNNVNDLEISNLFAHAYLVTPINNSVTPENQGYYLSLNTRILDSLCKARPASFMLQIPGTVTSGPPLSLELHKVASCDKRIRIKTSDGMDTLLSQGLHYWGHVVGQQQIGVAISFFEEEVMGLIEDSQGQHWSLEKVTSTQREGLYAMYAENNLSALPTYSCEAQLAPGFAPRILHDNQTLRSNGVMPINKTVHVYMECEYEAFTQQGSVTNTVNYVSALFNSVAMIYHQEGINVEISEFFVWTTADTYPNSALNALTEFKALRPSYNGDLAHLLTISPGPSYSGIAYVSGFCNAYGYAYSQIAASFADFPTYSWSVTVLAHEMGHNFGSPHTHDCAWNGNNTPIDGCGPVVGSPSNGCSALPPPVQPFKGTIMSYCHLIGGIGIDFNLGFGTQPGNLIRSAVAQSTCLPCDAPLTDSIGFHINADNSVSLSCTTIGVDQFDWRYRILGVTTWTDVASTSIGTLLLSGLGDGITYEFQLSVRCPADGTWSPWSLAQTFSLPLSSIDTDEGGVTDTQELINGTNPNNAIDDYNVASLQIKVLLQGALFGMNDGLMQDNLRSGGYLPLLDPYSSSGNPRFKAFGTGSATTTTPNVLSAGAGTKDAIVDWVFVELRDTSNAAVILETKAALLQRDGDVVDAADGLSPLRFSGNLPNKKYYIAVKHRNHLGVMSAKLHALNSPQTAIMDFRTAHDSLLYDRPGALDYNGVEMAKITVNSPGGDFATGTIIKALWAGNSNADGMIRYLGSMNDLSPILTGLVNSPGNTLGLYNYGAAFGYFNADLNMNGNLKYLGPLNEPTFILTPIIGFPLNTLGFFNYGAFVEQLP